MIDALCEAAPTQVNAGGERLKEMPKFLGLVVVVVVVVVGFSSIFWWGGGVRGDFQILTLFCLEASLKTDEVRKQLGVH